MASHLKKDPYTYEREHNAFLRELRQFHDSRGTPFRHPPRINGREVDLYALYNEMTIRGGWHKVNDTRNWDSVLQQLKLPKCPNATVALKHIYIRYLDKYEKIHFHGEDPDDDHSEKVDCRGRKVQTPASQVPMVYNYQQHDLTDGVRVQLGLSQDSLGPNEYDKLVLSLLSGLPNEVDFAINICTLLSNEGRHVLRLEKCPRLVEVLIAHAGVWSDSNMTLKSLLEESWSKVEGRRMSEFWEDNLDDMEIRELLGPWEGKSKEMVEGDKDLFNLSRHIGVRDSEGQRVLQIAAILRNLSFEGSNATVLASSPICLKFLLLCAHCRWSNLRQLGLDTLGSLATEMVLEPFDNISTQLIFRTITRNLQSNDRFLVIRSLEMLIGLCQVEANEDTLVKSLNNRVYEQVCAFLTIHDIMLLVYTLESLYHITLMGREPCTCISRIHGVIGTLISFLTLDIQTYGQEACIDMKLVTSSTPSVQPVGFSSPTVQPHKSSSIPSTTHSHRGAIPIPVGYQELDNESFACNWLKATYEISTGRSISHTDIYNEYQNVCIKLGKKGLVGPTQLANYVRSVFPHVMPRRVEGVTELVMDGIKKRMHPLPVSILAPTKSTTSNSGSPRGSGTSGQLSLASIPVSPSRSLSPSSNSNSQSPILKAQLSAPPRSPSSHHPHLQKALMSRSSPPSSPVTPSKDSNSNLIKSLLANKVNQNIQRQQLLKQKTVPHQSSTSIKNIAPVQSVSSTTSGPLTLEACLAIPVSNTPTLSTATRDSIGGATLTTTTYAATATIDTVSSNAVGVMASPIKSRTNSQLGAMLGHCNPPPPMPPPILTKELIAAQAAVKARLAEQSNSIVPTCAAPAAPSGSKLITPSPPQSHSITPKLRINGMQRLVSLEMLGKEVLRGNATSSPSESRPCVPENHISNPDVSNVNHSLSVVSESLSCESPEPEAVLKTVLPPAPKLQGVPITDGNIAQSSPEKPLGTTISLRLQNGTQIIAAPISNPGIQVTHASTIPTTVTATSSNPPSIFKCHELTNAQNSGLNPFANLPPSLQPPQPSKKKGGVLADLLDGKVHKDALFSMNGIVDRRPGDKKPISPFITNHQNDTATKTSVLTPVSVASTVPVSTAPSKNCNISNGDNMVNHSITIPRTVAATMVVAAAPVSSPSLKLPLESDKTNTRLLGSANGCGGKMLLVPASGILPINNTTRERTDDPNSKAAVQSVPTVTSTIQASNEASPKCTPTIGPNRTIVNSRFAVITPPKTEDLIGFPRVSMEQLKQLRQQAAGGTMRLIAKRPPTDVGDSANDAAKRIRTEDVQMQTTRFPASVTSQTSSPTTFLTPIAPKPPTIPLCGCITNATSVITTSSAPIASVILVSTSAPISTDASGKTTPLVAETSPGVVGIKNEFKWSVVNRSTIVPSSTVIVQKVKTKLAPEFDKVAVAARPPCSSPSVSSKCVKEEPLPSLSAPSAVVGTPSAVGTVVPAKVVTNNDSSNSNAESVSASTVPPSTVLPQPKLEFLCEWKDCKKSFESPSNVFFHACKSHTPKGNNRMPCMWENCDQMVRQRLSLMTHLQERHCNENVLRLQAMRRQELSRSGTSNIPLPAPPPPHPGYAPNAALHAIKRHALEYINSHDTASDEDNALTKSVRFTAALVLRNVITNSLVGRGLAKQYEGYLVTIAASNGDSSRTIAYCLAELGQHMEKCGT